MPALNSAVKPVVHSCLLTLSRIYISGKAHGDDGAFEIEETDDPHFFADGEDGHDMLLA